MKAAPIQESFHSGEISPLFQGRATSEPYKTGYKESLNYVPTLQGGLTRRPGTRYVGEVKNSANQTRIIPFSVSAGEVYLLEFGNLYVRFYKDGARIIDLDTSPTPLEVATPYASADLSKIRYVQSADVLYLVHPNHPPAKIFRVDPGTFSANPFLFVFGVTGVTDSFYIRDTTGLTDGPYFDTNITDITLTPSSATGTATVTTGPSFTVNDVTYVGPVPQIQTSTAHNFVQGQQVFISGVGGITVNGLRTVLDVTSSTTFRLVETATGTYSSPGTVYPALFESTDGPSGTPFTETFKPGRLLRMREGSTWGWALITAYVNPHQVNIGIISTLTNTNAKSAWALGLWSRTTGYPSVVGFHENRLFMGGSSSAPQRIDFSRANSYDSFLPTATDGTITAANAFSATLNSQEVNEIRWAKPDEKGLAVGTLADEWIIQAADRNSALSATNVTARVTSANGSAQVDALKVGKSILFVQNSGRKLRENIYFFDVDGFSAPDLSLIAEHITKSGVTGLAYSKEPHPIVWSQLNDGTLLGTTYAREPDSMRVGWHRHQLGGASDIAGSAPVVESMAVIPTNAGEGYDTYLLVRRRINGGTKRYIERMADYFESTTEQRNWIGVDCSITYKNEKTVTNVTNANPGQVTVTSHGYSNGDKVIFRNVKGMTGLNERKFTITVVDANNFTIGVSTVGFAAYAGGGTVEKLVSTVSGLSHLEGQVVRVYADGANPEDKTVSSGAITLTNPAATVTVGLGYRSYVRLLRIDAGSADGTSLGKTRRIHRIGVLLWRSYGVAMGVDDGPKIPLRLRNAAENELGAAPILFSGLNTEPVEADPELENEIIIEQDNAFPGTILAVMPLMVTYDR